MKKLLIVLLFAVAPLSAQEGSAPKLTEKQNADLTEGMLRMEIMQMRVQNAELQFQIARLAFESQRVVLQALLNSLRVDGWTFDPEKRIYTPAKPKPVEE